MQLVSKHKRIAGFTLIELLIVIAIIAILAAILLPVLAHAKLKGTQAYCLNNQKQLATGWYMYANDNHDTLLLAYTSTGGSLWPGTSPAGGFWGINNSYAPRGGTDTGAALTNVQDCLANNSLMYQYAANVGVYHCPGDVRFQLPIGANPAVGWAYDSYAIAEGAEDDPTASETNSFTRLTQIKRPTDCDVFVEQADTRGYNEGTFGIQVNISNIVSPISFEDVFSLYHGLVGTFSFADGHAEAKRWHDNVIIAAGLASVTQGSTVYDYSQYSASQKPKQFGVDAAWIIQHFSCPTDQ